ncbi:type I polyketide synthase [Chitinophaga tropicalis]|uniref:Acyltransferase domain-containing protein n=1 Tax=Chitinophaga tropicalis TaxID=2683588 RepID=A0A7K1UAP0_9BACT|nr:type I polyketide synthase [Chitinophaga tropicalis]MVT11423.1 acyltransferase domain-containing protein [Chitinophaga tropicalis]
MTNNQKYTGLEIAIVGMACRFPGARNWREFWDNLSAGEESIRFLSEEELAALGVDRSTFEDGRFVNAVARLQDKDVFDHSFFGYRPDDASIMNPVHRIFHECVWEALEDAGYDPQQQKGGIGLYVGAGDDSNWKLYAGIRNRDRKLDEITFNNLVSKDFLASLLAYKLNLKGPVFSVNTTCSTSLVAVSLACKSLLLGEAKMALAGGITIRTSKERGYFYKEGMILSRDGHCKAFDKEASGTVSGEGAGVVVLKRLADAIADRDHIYCVIKGSAINNDGSRKVGFTASSVEGQAECIARAHKFARVEPHTISYVEAHGTGTLLGDPIEIEALNIAFGKDKTSPIAIGSVKTNIGHLDTAAGVAGLIKTALSLKHKKIPASLHFTAPNPEIDFDGGPFYVNDHLQEWKRNDAAPLRAGISSFGIGGTNVHAVLEEAPAPQATDPERTYKLLTVSAKTEGSLGRYLDSLQDFLLKEPGTNLGDLSYTLQAGRKHFTWRQSLVYRDREDLLSQLQDSRNKGLFVRSQERNGGLVFLFPGQGSQYREMGRDLYAGEPVFRQEMDRGFSIIEKLTGEDFREVLFPSSPEDTRINDTRYTQALIFLVSYSLSRVLQGMGIKPRYMLGHSIGEYVAACMSGVFSFEDGLRLVLKRGALMGSVEKGIMVSVGMSAGQATSYLETGISLAAVNGPEQVVFSGEPSQMASLMDKLSAADIPHVKLHTSHAFHSSMQDPILEAFRSELEQVTFNKPELPFVSNLTGGLISAEQACSADYWVRHLRETVQFSQGVTTLLQQGKGLVFLEVGAGASLSKLVKQHLPGVTDVPVVNLVRGVKEGADDVRYLNNGLGQLWSAGVSLDWDAFYGEERRNRISLPGYSFEPVKFPTEVDPFESGFFSADAVAVTLQEEDTQREYVFVKQERNGLSTVYTAPATETEETLTALFEDFFGMEGIGVEDNFFELGGDSLKGMLLLRRIKKECEINLAVKDFFDRQTIRQIALYIDDIKLLLEEKSNASNKSFII